MRAGHCRLTSLSFAIVLFVFVSDASAQPSVTVSPGSATIVVGQSKQFTATATLVPGEVGAGGEYTCVLMSNGTESCTGRNQFGQLGNGSMNNSNVPVAVTGLGSIAHLVPGDEFSCALITDGSIQCWGTGEKGQRGDGTFTTWSVSPAAVTGVTTAVAAGAGYNHACAVLADGTLQCWGDNAHGQLGDSMAETQSALPVNVGGISSPLAIAVGGFHTCVLIADRSVRCWGQNGQGQVGDGTMDDAPAPVPVSGLSSVVSLALGGTHSCALLTDGTVQCWGNGYDGQLGNGTFDPSSTPVPVSGVTNAVAVAAGWAHTCALLQDGRVRCWGEGVNGELGDGTATSSPTPVAVAGVSGATAITAGWWHHSCAIAGGSVKCWGANDWGQLGNGTQTPSASPVAMSAAGLTWSSDTPPVASIEATGFVVALKAGIATITATDAAGATGTATVTVIKPRFVLSIAKTGATRDLATVSASSGSINCGSSCSDTYESDTVVTLTASPSTLLTGWSGCDSVSGATCVVTVQSARSVTARFLDVPPLQ